ncbi:MAG: hypothetical protein WAX89_02080 [Alphaproteobacteria bacterium]
MPPHASFDARQLAQLIWHHNVFPLGIDPTTQKRHSRGALSKAINRTASVLLRSTINGLALPLVQPHHNPPLFSQSSKANLIHTSLFQPQLFMAGVTLHEIGHVHMPSHRKDSTDYMPDIAQALEHFKYWERPEYKDNLGISRELTKNFNKLKYEEQCDLFWVLGLEYLRRHGYDVPHNAIKTADTIQNWRTLNVSDTEHMTVAVLDPEVIHAMLELAEKERLFEQPAGSDELTTCMTHLAESIVGRYGMQPHDFVKYHLFTHNALPPAEMRDMTMTVCVNIVESIAVAQSQTPINSTVAWAKGVYAYYAEPGQERSAAQMACDFSTLASDLAEAIANIKKNMATAAPEKTPEVEL